MSYKGVDFVAAGKGPRLVWRRSPRAPEKKATG